MDGRVVRTEGLEVAVAGREAAASQSELGHEARDEPGFRGEARPHLALDLFQHVFLGVRVFVDDLNARVENVRGLFAHGQERRRVGGPLLLLLFRIHSVAALGRYLQGQLGRHKGRRAVEGVHVLGNGLHLRHELDDEPVAMTPTTLLDRSANVSKLAECSSWPWNVSRPGK